MWLWWAPLSNTVRVAWKAAKNSPSCDVERIFSTEPIFGWNQCSGVQQAGFIWFIYNSACSLLLLHTRLCILLSSQLMKRVGKQDAHHALIQSGSASTKQGGKWKTWQSRHHVGVRDWRPADCSVSVKSIEGTDRDPTVKVYVLISDYEKCPNWKVHADSYLHHFTLLILINAGIKNGLKHWSFRTLRYFVALLNN